MKWLLLFGLLFQSSLGYDFDAFVKDMENYDTSDVYQVLDLLQNHEILNKDEVNFDLSEFDTADIEEDLSFTEEGRAAILAIKSKVVNSDDREVLNTLASKLLTVQAQPVPAVVPARYQYFRIVNGYSYLTLCAVQLYGQLNGVGLTRRIPLSTAAATQINTGWGGVAGRAVDNVDNPMYFGGHCSHTVTQRGSWWQVKLPGLWTLRTVRILNRKDCCAERLRALTFYGSVDGRSFKKLGFYPGPAGAGAWVLVRLAAPTPPPPPPPPPTTGLFSYFRIVNGYSYLTLCAVQLFGQLNGVGATVRINIPASYATQINTGWGGVASRAIDCADDPIYGNGHCSHTVTQRGSWWQARLPGRYRLRFVRILNRKDCCSDRLRTLTFQGSLDGRSFVNIGSYPGPAGAGAWITVPFRVVPPPPPPSPKFRYFRIVNGYSYLTLCAVQLFGQLNGVGVVKRIPTNPAWTRQINTGWGGVSGRAVDGVDNPNYFSGHCSHTVTQRGSWWQTMLPGYWSIKQVKILNRKDCCADRLRALTFYGSMGINGPFQKLGFYAGPAGAGAWVTVNLGSAPPTPKYQSFRIVNGFSYLTLCGVELYGKAGNGREVKLALTPPLATQINTGWGGVAGRAVDGNNNGNYFSGHCSHTVTQKGSWWQVRLPPVAGGWELTRVKIWNRADCCWDRLRSLSFYGGSSPTGGSFKRIGVYGGPAGRGAVVEVRLNSRGLLEALEALDEEDYDFTDEDINYDFEQEAIVEEYDNDDVAEADIEDDEQYDNYQNTLLIVNSNQNYLVQLFHQYPLFSIFAIFVLSFTSIYYFINRKSEKKLFSSEEYTPLKTNL